MLLRQAGDDAEAAGVGDRRCHLGKADIVHAALDDRMLDAEQFGDAGLHVFSPFGGEIGQRSGGAQEASFRSCYFWQDEQKKVERPPCTRRSTGLPQPQGSPSRP